MKTHWVNQRSQKQEGGGWQEIGWDTACGYWISDEEAEAGRGSPNAGDVTCGSCRRVAAAQVEVRLTRGVLQEIPL